jgi:ribose-phosphate pyrophosphokinase
MSQASSTNTFLFYSNSISKFMSRSLPSDKDVCLVAGSGNEVLARHIAAYMGQEMAPSETKQFRNGELLPVVKESVRGRSVVFVQGTHLLSSTLSVNDLLMETILGMYGIVGASASDVTLVLPCLPYARQDRKMEARVPISAACVTNMLAAPGTARLITLDLHCPQIQGMVPPDKMIIDNVPAWNLFVHHIVDTFMPSSHREMAADGAVIDGEDLPPLTIVSPDVGGAKRAEAFQACLKTLLPKWSVGIAFMNKHRPEAGEVSHMELVGNVEDTHVILVDDMIDSGGTLKLAATTLKELGAINVRACATHGLFSAGVDVFNGSDLMEIAVLDTVPVPPRASDASPILVLSCAKLLESVISRVHKNNKSGISTLFDLDAAHECVRLGQRLETIMDIHGRKLCL